MAIIRRQKPILVLPLSSMGDIAFLLIIFFMLASNFMKTANVDMEEPSSSDLEQQEAAKQSVTMDRNGDIWFQGQKVGANEVAALLKPFVEADKSLAVHVAIHNSLSHKEFNPLIQAVSESGAKLILTGQPDD